MNKLENKNRQNRVSFSPLKSANLLDINELADSPLKNGAQPGQQFPSLYDTLDALCKEKKCHS